MMHNEKFLPSTPPTRINVVCFKLPTLFTLKQNAQYNPTLNKGRGGITFGKLDAFEKLVVWPFLVKFGVILYGVGFEHAREPGNPDFRTGL